MYFSHSKVSLSHISHMEKG